MFLAIHIILDKDTSGNYSQGIHWLMRAADQGHEDAFLLLSECYQSRRGITDHNEGEVQMFLSLSPGERAARKAARELFACLSNGEEYITAAQLERKMREIYKIQKNRRKYRRSDDGEIDNNDGDENNDADENDATSSATVNGHVSRSPSHRSMHRNNVITEANLVNAADDYSNGFMPAMSNALQLSIPHPRTLDHIPCFHRLLFHPLLFLTLCYHRFVRVMSSFPETTRSHLQFLLLLFAYAMIAVSDNDSWLMFIPMGMYYLSLIVMIFASFKMLKSKHEFIDFRMWSGLFLSYGGDHNNIEADAAENQFLRNNMKPYLYYFIAFFANVMLYPIISDQWLPHSEITMISFVLVFVTMFAFMYSGSDGRRSNNRFPDLLILISFGVNVLAKYPYEMDTVVLTGWRFLDLKIPNFPSFVIGNGIEFCLNCRALLYLLIPGFLILLAGRRNWHGTYQYLIPHCVTLSWLQICIISSECATMFGLVRAALGLAGLLLFLPLFGMVTLMVPVFAAIEWLSLTDPSTKIAASICTTILFICVSCLLAAHNRTEKYITVAQIVICGISMVFLTVPYMTSNFETVHQQTTTTASTSSLFNTLFNHHKPAAMKYQRYNQHNHHHGHNDDVVSKLTWEQYYKYCNQPAWEHVNTIATQLRCSQLNGMAIKWRGVVTNVEISRVTNIRADIINSYLPQFWSDIISCWYGEQNTIQCANNEQCDDMKIIYDEQQLAKQCNLNKWNTYEYDITVRMNSGLLTKSTEIILRGVHSFGNFTTQLNNSDRIWFKGILQNTNQPKIGATTTTNKDERQHMLLGGKQNLQIIRLQAIGCVQCHTKDIDTYQVIDGPTVNGRLKDLYRGVKYLLNVLFNPLVIFK